MLSVDERARMQVQIALSKSLALGFALSLLPAAGVGSIAAIVIGVRAQRKIEASGEKLVGRGMAVWCVVVGAVGLMANAFMVWPMVFRL